MQGARGLAARRQHQKALEKQEKLDRHKRSGDLNQVVPRNRVYEVDEVTEDDAAALQTAGLADELQAWKASTGQKAVQLEGSSDDESDDSRDSWELDQLQRSIRDDDFGCRPGRRCCTAAQKRRPYCIDMDEGRGPPFRRRELGEGTRVYRCNRFCLTITNHKVFDTLVLLAILSVTVLVGAGTYTDESPVLDACEIVVQVWFVIEILAKMGARGPVFYFCQMWNIFDFSIVTLTLLPSSLLGGGSDSVAILRLLRLLRMAKLAKIDAVEAIISGLQKGMTSLFYIMVLLFLVFYVFSILGIILFAANDPMHFRTLHDALLTLFRVSTLEDWTDIMYLNMFGCGYTGYEYPSFNHSGATGLYDDPEWAAAIAGCEDTLAECLPPYWVAIATGNVSGALRWHEDSESLRWFNGTAAEERALLGTPHYEFACLHPSAHGWVAPLYFVIFVIISALVMLSLFIGLVSSEIETESNRIKEAKRKKALKNPKHTSIRGLSTVLAELGKCARCLHKATHWFNADYLRLSREAVFTREAVANSRFLRAARFVRKVCDHKIVKTTILAAILVAAATAGVETQDAGQTQAITDAVEVIEVVILLIFGLEVLMLVFAEGHRPWNYFREPMNCFDFAIVVICLLSLLLKDAGSDGGSSVQALRMLRLLRLLKLLDEIPELKTIVVGLQGGLSSIFFITMIMLLVYYLFAVVGLIMFQDNDPHHFKNLHVAMISLFRASTFEDWTDIMYINYLGCDRWGYSSPLPDPENPLLEVSCTMPNGGSWGAIVYFLSFIVVNAFIVLSLFIGVVTTSMIEAREEALIKRFQVELNAQLLRKFPIWLGGTDGRERMESFQETFNEIDEDQGGYIVLDELSDWLSEKKVPWSKDRRAALLEGLVVPRDDGVIKDKLNLAQFVRLHKATEMGMTPKELQHDIVVTEGRLKLTLQWLPQRPPQMQLVVTVLEAEGLTDMDRCLCFQGSNDPYVRVTVAGVSQQTRTIQGGGRNPAWNVDGRQGDVSSFELSELPSVVHVRAYDEDEGSLDDIIGEGQVDIGGKSATEEWELEDWVSMRNKAGRSAGRCRIHLRFAPVSVMDNHMTESEAKLRKQNSIAHHVLPAHHNRAGGQFRFTVHEGKNLTSQVRLFSRGLVCSSMADHGGLCRTGRVWGE